MLKEKKMLGTRGTLKMGRKLCDYFLARHHPLPVPGGDLTAFPVGQLHSQSPGSCSRGCRVRSGCHSKTPWTGGGGEGGLKAAHNDFPLFSGLEVQGQDSIMARFLWEPSFWLASGHPVSSHGRERGPWSPPLFMRTLTLSWGLHLHDLM